MTLRTFGFSLLGIFGLSGCNALNDAVCAPNCHSEAHNSSSLVTFLYPDGKPPPPDNQIPQLRLPLKVGLAFLPSDSTHGAVELDAAHKSELLERIRKHFSTRDFVSEIVIIPDYYLTTNRGFSGLEGVQRLYNVDLMALVSHDQITYQDANKLSLGYLTIVGAYVLKGNSHDVTTLVDLAVVDPATRSLVLRAGGTDTRHGTSTLIDQAQDTRAANLASFSAATDQVIEHFDTALNQFQADVKAGKAQVAVSNRNGPTSGGGGMGVVDPLWLSLLMLMVALRCPVRWRP